MSAPAQTALRWEPIVGLPETPCGDIKIESARFGQLRLILLYSEIVGNDARDLVLDFSDVLAFRSYWDGDGNLLGSKDGLPKCRNRKYPFTWPLLAIDNSLWIASDELATSRGIAAGLAQPKWRQFSIVGLERGVDVIARGSVAASWLDSHTD